MERRVVEEVIEIEDVTLTPTDTIVDIKSAYTAASPILSAAYVEKTASPRDPSFSTCLASSVGKSALGNNCNVNSTIQDSWLPITESINGNAFYAAFHTLNSGIGFQALVLPVAFTVLGWAWGIICLSLLFGWQFYTIWLLIQLHESVPGTRYNRYLHLTKAAFGEKLGKLLALFPVMYLSGGACVMLMITSSETMKLFVNIVFPTTTSEPLSTIECHVLFICVAIALSQVLLNLNSMAWISFIGGVAAISYCTLLSIIFISHGRPSGVSFGSVTSNSNISSLFNTLNAIGIIALAFRGHNLILEIQATIPSREKHPSRVPMWTGVKYAYVLIALCLLSLAVAGYWANGNKVGNHGGMLNALQTFYGQYSTTRYLVTLTTVLILIHCLTSFQLYAVLAYDNMEFAYTTRKKKPCQRWLRYGFRVFFGCVTLFVAVALPFVKGLTGLIGGIALPVTLAYPCFMWINIRKPQHFSAMWCINMVLGSLGMMLSASVFAGGIWSLIHPGIDVRFFKP